MYIASALEDKSVAPVELILSTDFNLQVLHTNKYIYFILKYLHLKILILDWCVA